MIDLGVSGRLSNAYIASDIRRLAMYQRLAACEDQEGIKQVVGDLQSGYGQLPESALRLVAYHELKITASFMGIGSMTIDEGDVVIRTRDPAILQDCFDGIEGTLRTVGEPSTSDYTAVYFRSIHGANPVSLLSTLHTQLVRTPVSSPMWKNTDRHRTDDYFN
jgi:hypothetical protein